MTGDIERAGEAAYAGENSYTDNPYLCGPEPDPRAAEWWRGWDRARRRERLAIKPARERQELAAKRERIARLKREGRAAKARAAA